MPIIKFPSKKLNKKKVIVFFIACSVSFLLLLSLAIYYFNPSFRKFIDVYILNKEITSERLPLIDIASEDDQFFYAYDKYIVVLNKKILYTYDSSGENISTNDINICSPIFANNNKFLVMAENNGNNIYLICGSNILWQSTLDGNISNVSVNKNGYVSVILSGTSYKSIIVTYDYKGSELFRTYLSNNLAIATDISSDNKYLSIAEINYSGSIIKSAIKNISIEKAKTDPTNSVVYTYNFKDSELLTNIKYQEKSNLLCLTTNNIYLLNISDFVDQHIMSIDTNFEFIDINLKNNYVYTTNNYYNFNNISYINIVNSQNNSTNTYEFKGSVKELYTNEEKIAINTGAEVHFIGLNGWLIKKYDSYNEIINVIIGDSIAGIIYKDKIRIVAI